MVTAALRNASQRLLKSAMPRQWVSLAHKRHLLTDVGEYELTQVSRYLDTTRRAIDVGCHNGIYACHFMPFVKGVIAFEANPLAAQFIRRALPAVLVENVALSSQDGAALLRIPIGTKGTPLDGQATIDPQNELGSVIVDKINVPTRRLDSYKFDDVGFVKIDVEGHEEDVLLGASDLIARARPTFLVEIEERHKAGSLGRITRLFESAGYTGHFFMPDSRAENRRLADLKEFDAKTHQADELIELLQGTPRRRVPYVNNFLFLPN